MSTIVSINAGNDLILNQTNLLNVTSSFYTPSIRTPLTQAGYQLAALVTTFFSALSIGGIVGLIVNLPIFDRLVEDIELFDDEAQWKTPDDYALKLTLARKSGAEGETPMTHLGGGRILKISDGDDTNV